MAGFVSYRSSDTLNDVPVTLAQPLPVTVISGGGALAPKGYQQITTLSSAQALTVPGGSTSAVVTVEGQAVRFRDDGTNPTASVGMPIAVGGSYTFNGAADLAALKFIEQAASAKLNISYYG